MFLIKVFKVHFDKIMVNYINKDNSLAESPKVNLEWKQKSEKDRIKLITDKLITNPLYSTFEVVKADENAQVILRIEKSIPASKRGVMLLELEEMLKNLVDKSITIWLEPVGDKSKLRNLRGIKFKDEE
tara:strand:- start:1820 stop:2206 length:387 start_codon:yes stop_codon:yes gene_type:complete